MEPPRYTPASVRRALADALAREGVPPPVREIEAALMTEAELHGVPSHGCLMLPRLIAGLRGRLRARRRSRARPVRWGPGHARGHRTGQPLRHRRLPDDGDDALGARARL